MKPKSKPDDPEQSKEFIRIARELGADRPPVAADQIMGNLAKRPPEPHKSKAKALGPTKTRGSAKVR